MFQHAYLHRSPDDKRTLNDVLDRLSVFSNSALFQQHPNSELPHFEHGEFDGCERWMDLSRQHFHIVETNNGNIFGNPHPMVSTRLG